MCQNASDHSCLKLFGGACLPNLRSSMQFNQINRLALIISTVLGTAACSNLAVVNKAEPASKPPVMQSHVIQLEDDSELKSIDVSNSQISISDTRYIYGDKSLKWDYEENGAIIFRTPINLIDDLTARSAWGRASTQVLSFWIYNEAPVDDYMIVDLGRGLSATSNGDAGFKVHMNFTGWRAVGVSLLNDIQGREIEGIGLSSEDGEGMGTVLGGVRSDMDSIRFIAPKGQGTFYVDRVMLSIDDARYQWSDYQVKTRIDIPEIDFGIPDNVPKATEKEIQAANDIRNALVDVFTSAQKLKGATDINNLEEIRRKFREFDIKKNADGVITGRHISNEKQLILYQPDFMTPEDQAFVDDYIMLGDYSNILLNIGKMWNTTNEPSVKQELADMYVLMTEHLIDQGYYRGSSQVTTHHWGYYSRWWYISAMLMADVLTEHNLRMPIYEALVWYSREFKENFDMIEGPQSSDLDYFNTLSRQHLALLMLEPDMNRRVALLKKFGNYIDIALSRIPDGGYDGLRPDGTAWRHEGQYAGYAFPAFNNAAQLIYMLNGTPFEVGSAGRQALKKSMMAAWIYSNPQVGLGLSGRHPFNPPELSNFDTAFQWLALTGDSETGETLDKELASVYLQIKGLSKADSVTLFGQEVEPAALPEGAWAFNGGAFGIHRYGDNMVTMKGYNSNVWSSEIYYRDNRYGRYQSHGAVQVVPYGDQHAIGFTEAGFDWNRNIGTTTIHLPYDKLDSPNSHTLMLRGDQPFSGASALDGQYGAFGFKFQAPSMPKFDSSFTSRKSTFTMADRVVMVGSDISNSTNEYHTETTLFQHGITEKVSDLIINGDIVTEFPYQTQLGNGDWLIDGHGNGYLITSDVNVEVRLQHQESRQNKTRAKTEGNFSLAWIDHGTAPKSANYEYLVVLDATTEKMIALAEQYQSGQKVYIVEQADSKAHVVTDESSGVTSYVAFESTSFSAGVVQSVATPSIVMTRIMENGQLSISGTTPDLNMTRYTAPKPITVSTTIKGAWKAVEVNEKVKVTTGSDSTTLEFEIFFGIPQELTLEQVQ